MKNLIPGTIALAAATTLLLSLAGVPAGAADSAPLTPEYAAKKENHRRQKEQLITHDKRQAAAEGLKAERIRVYEAKQARYGKHGKGAGQDGTHAKPENQTTK